MNQRSLKGRVERIEHLRHPPSHRPIYVTVEEGEDVETACRRAGAYGAVAVGPRKCATDEEWERLYAPKVTA